MILPFFILALAIIGMFEDSAIMYIFHYKPFKKCLGDAFFANVITILIGVFLISPFVHLADKLVPTQGYAVELLIVLGLFYAAAIIEKSIILKILNKSFPAGKLIAANLLMNFMTYFILFFLLQYADRYIPAA